MSGKASGCWLDAVTPELLPVQQAEELFAAPGFSCGAHSPGGQLQYPFRGCNKCCFLQCCMNQ